MCRLQELFSFEYISPGVTNYIHIYQIHSEQEKKKKKKPGFYITLQCFKHINLSQESSAVMKVKNVTELVLAVNGTWVANEVSIVIAHIHSKAHRQKKQAARCAKIIPFPNTTALPRVPSYFINCVIKSRMLYSTNAPFSNSLELETGNYNWHRSQVSFYYVFTVNVQFVACNGEGECD